MYRILRERNEGLKGRMVAFAQKLVQTPSISLDEKAVADLVEKEMIELGYDRVIRDDAGNVVGIIVGREPEPTVLLNCHMDTVPVNEDKVWNFAPHSGEISDGWLHGVGAADCKGGLAAQVYAGALLKQSLLPFKGNLIVAATTAEENGRSIGVRELMKKTLPGLELKPTSVILGEPTNARIYHGHDGWMELNISVEGINPFQVDDAAAAILSTLGSDAEAQTDDLEMQEVSTLRFDNENAARRATIRMSRRLLQSENAETVVDQIKRNASVVSQPMGTVAVAVQVRTSPQKLYSGMTTMVKHITHAWTTDPFCPLMERARQALAAGGGEAKPGKWKLGRLGMGTAGGTFVKEFNIPTIGYGPGVEEQAHAVNEAVEIDKMTEVAYGTAVIVHGLVGVPVWGWTSDEI